MSDSRWQQVEDVFQRAVDLAPEARAAFLDDACGADLSLRREVESLLAHERGDGDTFAEVYRAIAHYRITGKLGQGGMGTVYRATDTKLGREVAIKVLPRSFADDADRMARFTREAKVLASLNHPHIAQIYGLEERALVMELVPGATLQGPLPLATALSYAKQIAEALEAAHEKGIVHRDLKPANVVVTPEGVVKLLDFGLAAVAKVSPSSDDDPMKSPTVTMQATHPGMIMGTAAYMSPEQAAGKPVDKRADVWSFGVLLCELLTGRRLFEGETISLTLAEVLRGPIDFGNLPRETPAGIQALLRRCLNRDVTKRLRDIGEARIAIDGALAGEMPEAAPPSTNRSPLPWSVAAALAVALAALAFLHFRENPPPESAPVRFQIPPPENATLEALLNVSPDGRKLAFIAGERLWVHFLESGESRNLTVSGGTPFWSPDSRSIAYTFAGKIHKIDVAGGPPQTVTDFCCLWGGGAWNHDNLIVFSVQTGLFRVPASGGVPVQITAVDPAHQESIHYSPTFLPDGRHFFYTRRSNIEGKSAIYIGSVDEKPEQQSSRPLVNSFWGASYAPSAEPGTGYVLFVREDTLMAQPFDNRRLELIGQATPIAEDVSDGRAFSVSANGALIYHRSASERQLTWYDRDGHVTGAAGNPGNFQSLTLSPDGTRLAVTMSRAADAASIWLLEISRDGSASTRFTFGSSDRDPLWSPDGSRIVFSSNRAGHYDLYQKLADGAKDEVVLLNSGEDKDATSWSRDGRFLLYTVFRPETKNDIWVLPLEGGKKPFPFLATEYNEREASFSPDGHWVAYNSYESGGGEVYVRSFSTNSDGTAVEAGGKWLVSNGGGTDPRWRADGQELYYLSLDKRLMTVSVATSPVFRTGKPRPLGLVFGGDWDFSADGKHFLAPAAKSSKPEPYTVVLNWQADLKKQLRLASFS